MKKLTILFLAICLISGCSTTNNPSARTAPAVTHKVQWVDENEVILLEGQIKDFGLYGTIKDETVDLIHKYEDSFKESFVTRYYFAVFNGKPSAEIFAYNSDTLYVYTPTKDSGVSRLYNDNICYEWENGAVVGTKFAQNTSDIISKYSDPYVGLAENKTYEEIYITDDEVRRPALQITDADNKTIVLAFDSDTTWVPYMIFVGTDGVISLSTKSTLTEDCLQLPADVKFN